MFPLNNKTIMVTLGAVLAVSGAFVGYQHFSNSQQDTLPTQESQAPSTVPQQETIVTIPTEEQTNIESNTIEQAPEEEITSLRLNYLEEQNLFELPLQGASAFASVAMNLRESPNGSKLVEINEGEGFTIVEDLGEWWKVSYQGVEGYVYANYCLLNLPDVIPSAIYANTNATSSVFQSSYFPLEGVTGEMLYEAYEYNERLGQEQYTMVILYQTARKIAEVQQNCLANGETLIINETYRPYQTQRQVVNAMTALSKSNATVLEGITKPPWSISWFISTGISNHQLGFAIDTSLGKVLATEERITGDYVYQVVTEYEEFPMPTPIHELSYHSASKDMEYTTIEVPRVEAEADPEAELDPEANPEPELDPEANPETAPESEQETSPEAEEIPDSQETPLPEPEAPNLEIPEIPEAELPTPPEAPPELPQEEQQQLPEPETWVPAEVTESTVIQAMSYGLQFLSEEIPEEEPLMDTITTSKWITAETMTDAALRLQAYFVAVGMEPIGSEWWHFNDFNNKGPGNAHRDYYITGIYSQEPWLAGLYSQEPWAEQS